MTRGSATVTCMALTLAACAMAGLTITGSGTKVVKSWQDSDYKVALTNTTIPRVVSSGGMSIATNSGRVNTNYSTATVYFDQQITPLVSGTLAVGAAVVHGHIVEHECGHGYPRRIRHHGDERQRHNFLRPLGIAINIHRSAVIDFCEFGRRVVAGDFHSLAAWPAALRSGQ